MALLQDPLNSEIKPKAQRGFLDNKALQIVRKGTKVTNLELLNLCLLNKERDELEDEQT